MQGKEREREKRATPWSGPPALIQPSARQMTWEGIPTNTTRPKWKEVSLCITTRMCDHHSGRSSVQVLETRIIQVKGENPGRRNWKMDDERIQRRGEYGHLLFRLHTMRPHHHHHHHHHHEKEMKIQHFESVGGSFGFVLSLFVLLVYLPSAHDPLLSLDVSQASMFG